MTAEERKAFVRRHYHDLIDGRDLSVLDRDLHPDFVDHDADPTLPPGIEGSRAWLRGVLDGSSDLRVEVHDAVAEGDDVVVRVRWSGTHDGPFLGRPATGRPLRFDGIVWWRFDGDRIVERWAQVDRLTVLRTVGALPDPGVS